MSLLMVVCFVSMPVRASGADLMAMNLDECEILLQEGNGEDCFVDVIGRNRYSKGRVDVDGNSYEHGLEAWIVGSNNWAKSVFSIGGDYDVLRGCIVLLKGYDTTDFKIELSFMDGEYVLASYVLTQESLPMEIAVDVCGVKQLTVYARDLDAKNGGTSIGLVNMILRKEKHDVPEDGLYYNGNRYVMFSQGNLSWSEACAFCENEGGHMATISSQRENDVVYRYMTMKGERVYFDFSDYTHWQDGEPKGKYAMLDEGNEDGTWQSGDFLEDDKVFLCEWEDPYVQRNYFVLGRDNNSFDHTTRAFFGKGERNDYGTKYLSRLQTLVDIPTMMFIESEKQWNGSSFGLAVSQVMRAYTKECYHDMDMPRVDTSFRDVINYYQLLRHTSVFEEDAVTYKDEMIAGWDERHDELNVFLQKLVLEAKKSEKDKIPFVLSYYFDEKGVKGHHVIVCGYDYDDFTGDGKPQHRIKIYDVNGVDKGYLYMYIQDDYTSFSFIDANHSKSKKDLKDMYVRLSYVGIGNYLNHGFYRASGWSHNIPTDASLTKDGRTIIAIPMSQPIVVKNDNGQMLRYGNDGYEGDMHVYSIRVIGEEVCRCVLEVDESEEFTFEGYGEANVSAYMNGTYMDVETEGSQKITLHNEQGIVVEGDEYTFTGYMGMKEGKVAKGSGKTNGTVNMRKVDDTVQLEGESVEIQELGAKTFGFYSDDGNDYWYENGVRQGIIGDSKNITDTVYGKERGREIYDPVTDGWYWLDCDNEGAKATNKEVWIPYINQEDLEKGANKEGKWVRYDSSGKMIKGWYMSEYDIYHYDKKTGEMLKGWRIINDRKYHFDEKTGILISRSGILHPEYEYTLKKYKEHILGKRDEIKDDILSELSVMNEYNDANLDTVGYAFTDINGDGVDELFIGPMEQENYWYGNGYIYDLFVNVNGEIKRMFGSASRYHSVLGEDKLIYNEGSGGASSHGYNLFAWDGTEKVIEKTAEVKYHENDGTLSMVYYAEGSDDLVRRTDMTVEEIEAMFTTEGCALRLTPFSELKG